MNNSAIGVFDSGIGGLTTVRALNLLLPNENIIYLGDTARIPYGTRSRETIHKYAMQDIAFLERHDVKMIIVACGTVSAIMMSNPLSFGDKPSTGVLLPAVQAACTATRNGRVGVIGTSATIKSGSYGKAMRSIKPDVNVIGRACPMFVPLVENGYTSKDCKAARFFAEEYLEVMKTEKVDTLILGCTHYPLLADIITDVLGDGVTLISPGEEAARYSAAVLSEKELLTGSTENGTNEYYVSDSAQLFTENCSAFLGGSMNGKVYECELEV
jgi:glutamate racemase